MKKIIALTAMVLAPFAVQAAEKNNDKSQIILDRVTVIGKKENIKNISGSAHFIDKKDLEKHEYSDINRVLRQVPGVNITEEEGYGNRPNIGLRGTGSTRTEKITIMEDGVLIQPAAYSAPAAYYFPRVARMESVEVRKGSSTIEFGPRTNGGAINFISSSIPKESKGKALVGFGSFDTERFQLNQGNTIKTANGNFGYVFDVSHEETDGFKKIDVVGGDTGYSIQDAMAKLQYSTKDDANIYQSFELKLGYTKEDSDETYLGLTDADFKQDAYRRYAASQEDNMDANHEQIQLRHFAEFEDFDVTTTLYNNEFSRNWYKLDNVRIGGVSKSLAASLADASYLAALKGQTNLAGDAANSLTVRANNREYYSRGVQSNLVSEFDLGKTQHKIKTGARLHFDQEDRFQHDDRYGIQNGVMFLANSGAAGSNANRESNAESLALHVIDEIKYKKFTLSPGIRYEHIKLESKNLANNTKVDNTIDAFVPGVGAIYNLTQNFDLLAGVHKGFSAPTPGSADAREEESVNYEAGVRYQNKNSFNAELIGFYNDYSNLLGECKASSGCDVSNIGDKFNGGAVEVKGVEASLGYDLAQVLLKKNSVKLPISFNYTYTKATFQSTFQSTFEEWVGTSGNTVYAGDELPYLPQHQFYISAGVEFSKVQFDIAGKYIDKMRTVAGRGALKGENSTDEIFIVDLAAKYSLNDKTKVFVNIENLFDRELVVSRSPAGVRPTKPLAVFAGLKYDF